jgi:hypothetical protein
MLLNPYAFLKKFLNAGFFVGTYLKISGSGNRKTQRSGKISGLRSLAHG